MICPNCKKRISENNDYCSHCGIMMKNWHHSSILGIKKIKRSLITLSISLITICALFFFINSFTKPDPIDFIKTGIINIQDSQPVGQAFENYFRNPKWTSFETDEGETVIEFNGEIQSSQSVLTCLIQFTIYYEENTFEITYYELDHESQTYEQLIHLLDSIYAQ